MATQSGRGGTLGRLLILLLFCALWPINSAWAQEGEPGTGEEEEGAAQETSQPRTRLFITATDTSAVPLVTLRSYGFSPDGSPLDFAQQSLTVRHGGESVEEVEVAGTVDVGTFTVFLIDATPGVEAQIPAIRQAIEQYASSAYMQEQVDAVAIYRVGPESAVQALEPTGFYNSIRNHFAEPFQPQDGPTALIDSTVGLLNNMDTLNPNAAMVPSIIVFSDGTDAVSTQFQAEDVAARAAELAIPVHTIWLENSELTVGREAGRNYLAGVAGEAYGVAGRMDQPQTVSAIFERIVAFRAQQIIRYNAPVVSSGTLSVELALTDQPQVQAQSDLTINPASPTVTLNVPPDSRTLQLPDLEEPVSLALSAEVSWLDGTERTLQQARLFANDIFVSDVDVDELGSFSVAVDNLVFGENRLQVSVTDDQGLQAVSPEVTLTVVEGERQIPEALQPAGGLLTTLLPVCLGALGLVVLLGLAFWLLRSGRMPGIRLPRGRRRRPTGEEEGAQPGTAPAAPGAEPARVAASADHAGPGQPAQAFLDVLETETQMPSHIPLQGEEIRLGRSPSLSDVAFEQDITVSRLHATILWDGHSYRLYDDDSTSGTWVNGEEVPDYGAQLFDGDDIYLGKLHLRFRQR